jgi:Zn-dependent alcohol dehydrogenase
MLRALLTEVYTRIPDISAREPNFALADFINGVNSLPATCVDMSLFDLTLYEKQLRGSLFGSSNPRHDIPRMLDLYRAGQLELDELITREYNLEEVNEGYADMHARVNLRGLIRF